MKYNTLTWECLYKFVNKAPTEAADICFLPNKCVVIDAHIDPFFEKNEITGRRRVVLYES